MRLESALYASREGLAANGQAIAVVGDNVANANTVGYRTSRAEFSDLLGEQENSSVSGTLPGAGDGVYVSAIRQIHEPGTLEFTGRNLDVGIGGGGFFMVGTPEDTSYTRAGNFRMSEDGTLVTAEGQSVLGYAGTQTETLGPLNLLNVDQAGTPTSLAQLVGNLNASADVTTVPAAPESFNDIAATASFVATQQIFDSLGASHDATVAFFKTGANTWTVQAYMNGGDIEGGEAGVPVQIGQDAQLNFLPTGALDPASAEGARVTDTPTYTNGAGGAEFSIDFSRFTQFAGGSIVNGITQDGQGTGNIASFEFTKDGEVFAILDNGSSTIVGTIPLANFTNLDGLQRRGNALYQPDSSAGERTLGAPGSGAFGVIEGGALEQSTVDISSQFTNLILYQRGYQASSQTLNVSNELLQQTLSLIR